MNRTLRGRSLVLCSGVAHTGFDTVNAFAVDLAAARCVTYGEDKWEPPATMSKYDRRTHGMFEVKLILILMSYWLPKVLFPMPAGGRSPHLRLAATISPAKPSAGRWARPPELVWELDLTESQSCIHFELLVPKPWPWKLSSSLVSAA